MGTIGSAWGITVAALQSTQAALTITANNTANANTEGYARQTANWEENTPVLLGGRLWGTGARVTGALSQRDRVLEERIQQQTQLEQSSATRLSALKSIELIFSDALGTDQSSAASGIGNSLNEFFNSVSQLQGKPSGSAERRQVLSACSSLADSFNSASLQLRQETDTLDKQVNVLANQVNALTDSLAKVNQQIKALSPGADGGTLEDQRQLDLKQLSALIGVYQVKTESGGLTITTSSGVLLVASGNSYPLGVGQVSGSTHVFDSGGNDLTASLADGGGQMGGLLLARDQDIPQVEGALDTLAYSLGSQINAVQQGGVDAQGNAGVAIFSLPAGASGAAGAIKVAITDPAQIAAAATGAGAADNSNLLAMLDLQDSQSVAGATPTAYYADFVSTLGSLTSRTQTLNTVQASSLAQLQDQRDAISAVNMDDQAAALQNLERCYQAASKMFSILNSILSSALNLGVQTSVG